MEHFVPGNEGEVLHWHRFSLTAIFVTFYMTSTDVQGTENHDNQINWCADFGTQLVTVMSHPPICRQENFHLLLFQVILFLWLSGWITATSVGDEGGRSWVWVLSDVPTPLYHSGSPSYSHGPTPLYHSAVTLRISLPQSSKCPSFIQDIQPSILTF